VARRRAGDNGAGTARGVAGSHGLAATGRGSGQSRHPQSGQAALPMPPPPRGIDWHGWEVFKGMPVVPPQFIDYQPERGAQWLKPEIK